MADDTPQAESKPERVGLSGPERMFWNEMDAMGATMDAFIQRSTRPWWADQFTFQITLADGTKKTGSVPWNLETFAKVLAAAKGDAS